MKSYEVLGKEYPIIGEVRDGDTLVPLVGILMMSDEDWNRQARENAVHNYILEFGREHSSVEAAVAWQRSLVAELAKYEKKAPLIRQDTRGTTIYF